VRIEAFSPKQLRVLSWWCPGSGDARRDAVICDGAVRSGKTVCMMLSFILWAFYRFEGQAFGLCGKTIRALRRNAVAAVLPLLRGMGFHCAERAAENTLYLEYAGRRNRFYLFGGRDEGSAAMIQGVTLAGVLCDEVALMPRSFVEQALARCSVEGSKFWFNCNPEYPGHWFYREWICKTEEKNALYLHFTMEDNPALSRAMRKRYESLYTGTFYERFVLGRWVAAAGAVYPFMAGDAMYCPPPAGGFARYAVSCDYGTVNPASFGLWGEQGGVWYRLREYYYDSKREGAQRTDEEHYAGLCRLAGDEDVECVVVDPSAASFLEVIRRHGRFCALPAENDVLSGIRRVSTALKEGKIRICTPCVESRREFSLYRWEEGGQDKPVKEHDHAMDDIRYFVSTLLRGGEGAYALAARRTTGGFDHGNF
jgi:PBSX family phage terminase large subunit